MCVHLNNMALHELYIVSFILVYTWRARRGTRGCRSCHKYPAAALIISFYAIILFGLTQR